MEDILRSRILHIFLICIATVLGSSVSRASQKIQPLTAGSFWSSDSYLGGDDCLGNSKEWAKIGVNIKNQSTWFVGQTRVVFNGHLSLQSIEGLIALFLTDHPIGDM
jgi:hypothetical protein